MPPDSGRSRDRRGLPKGVGLRRRLRKLAALTVPDSGHHPKVGLPPALWRDNEACVGSLCI